MAIPQSDQPLFDIEILSKQKKFKFRPFLVKEEKILVLATQSADLGDLIKAIQQVITNCSFGEIQGDELPVFDLQKTFLELRSQSISPVFGVNFTCGFCQEVMPGELDLRDFEISQKEDHKNPIKISDKVQLVMGYPSASDLVELGGAEQATDIYNASSNCLLEVHTADEVIDCRELTVEERLEYIENMSLKDFEHVKNFFETMPVLEHEINFTCKNKDCAKESSFYMNGYLDFFV
jgi:hypothetical protein